MNGISIQGELHACTCILRTIIYGYVEIVIIFAELTRFHKTEDECITEQDQLLYLLKNSGKMMVPPKWAARKPCKNILDAFRIGDFSKEKRNQYNQDMYDEKRRNGELAAARNDGLEEGRAKAFVEMAQKMLAAGLPVEQISQLTGLSAEEIKAL